MKTKKSNDKKETKIKANKSLVLRNDSKVKQKSIQSSERLCNRCKVHGITVSFKGHKCPNVDCLCIKCQDYIEKNRRRNEQNKRRLNEKKTNKDNKSKDNISFVNTMKNKSKKILNNKKKDKKDANTGSASKKKKKIRMSTGSGHFRPTTPIIDEEGNRISREERSSPPRLILQGMSEPPIDALIDNNSSATDINVDINHSNSADIQPVPEKSSAPLCAQYLKACEGLSRKLSKYQFSEDELIASLKYFIVRQSLGDIERAANDIICASQEIRLGASYIIQHPCDDLNHQNAGQTTSTSVRQIAQPSVSTAAAPLLLCSTMYPNYRSKGGPTYSPAFTPIRNNN